MFWVVVLLQGEPPPQFFLQDCSPSIFASILNSWCYFSAKHRVLHVGQNISFQSDVNRAPSVFPTCIIENHRRHLTVFAFFNNTPVNRFSLLSCGSLQLLLSYHGPLGRKAMSW
ncbi:hypothetical protein AMECASPLE_030048 [Ameca splendens]|uniref:Secreted protein n=1 Tax=Ameca splendens TaxID=208324 RepID=A0ABV0YH01_9TELE